MDKKTYPIITSKKLWEIPELTHINRMEMNSGQIPFADREKALGGVCGDSPWFQSLDGSWKFSLVKKPESVTNDMLASKTDDSSWDDISVPGNWTMMGYWDKPIYTNVKMPYDNTPPVVPEDNPTGVYRTHFSLPKNWDGRRIIIHFGGVENYYEVYLNDIFVGMAKDNRLPSEFDITDAVKTDGENMLAVKVIKWCDANYIEDQDQWWHGGIHRSVYLHSTDRAYIQDIFAHADLDVCAGSSRNGNPYWERDFQNHNGLLDLNVKLNFAMSTHYPIGPAFKNKGPQQDYFVEAELFAPNNDSVFKEKQSVKCSFRESGYTCTFKTCIKDCLAWSAEQPNLYKLTVTLLDNSGTEIETRCIRTGFRNIEIRNRELLINGRCVEIRGVNRHEHDDTLGKVMTREVMLKDILLLKQFNFNAVRTSHYPSCPEWYDLCDEYGIYVLDEANLETHDNYSTLCRDPRWTNQFVERGRRMVLRDRNHPCVFGWSLGNESGYGENHDKMADAMRALDNSRIFHNEGELKSSWGQGGWTGHNTRAYCNDMIDPMYPALERLSEWAKNNRDHRPFIMCEYAHAMGNSCGGLKDYWDAVKSHQGLQGGFIWEWIDHGIKQTDDKGRDYWAYGGDFGESIHDFNFCTDGMIWPDRTPHPCMFEFKKLVQPIRVEALDLSKGKLRINNVQYFTDMSWLKGTWELTVDGNKVSDGDLPERNILPELFEDMTIDLPKPEMKKGQECHLMIRFIVKEKQSWCEAGHEIAWDQFLMPFEGTIEPSAALAKPVQLTEDNSTVTVTCGELKLTADKTAGTITSLSINGNAVLNAGPELNIWRATTDNDGIRGWNGQDNKPMGQWLNEGFNEKQTLEQRLNASKDGDNVVLTIKAIHTGKDSHKQFIHVQKLTVTPAGIIRIDNLVDCDETLPTLPRIGVTMSTAAGFETVEWFGRGPGENHIDRNEGSPVGHYKGTVDEQLVNYCLPQENGNKSDVRRFSLDNGTVGVRFEAAPRFEFSVRHFTDTDLFTSYHTNELQDKKRPETIINLDHIQRGVGTGSCGPQTFPHYHVNPGHYEFSYTIIPYHFK